MQFTSQQIELACQLKDAGLSWTPAAGQYAFDREKRIRPGSPFQDHVYFFLDFPCFVEYFGDVHQLAMAMVWLPTWEEVSVLLAEWRATRTEILNADTLARQQELDDAYRWLLKNLR